MGGMISLRMAATAPHRLLSLSLLGTRHEGGLNLPTWGAIWTILKMQVTARSVEAQLQHMLNLFYPQKYLDQLREPTTLSTTSSSAHESESKASPETIPTVKETNRQYLTKILLERQEGIPPATSAGLLGQLGAIYNHGLTTQDLDIIKNGGFRILLITGDDDYMIPHVHTLKMKNHFGDGAELVLLEGAGHGILEQCEGEIKEKLHSFFVSDKSIPS